MGPFTNVELYSALYVLPSPVITAVFPLLLVIYIRDDLNLNEASGGGASRDDCSLRKWDFM